MQPPIIEPTLLPGGVAQPPLECGVMARPPGSAIDRRPESSGADACLTGSLVKEVEHLPGILSLRPLVCRDPGGGRALPHEPCAPALLVQGSIGAPGAPPERHSHSHSIRRGTRALRAGR